MGAPKKSISEKFHAWKEVRAVMKEERQLMDDLYRAVYQYENRVNALYKSLEKAEYGSTESLGKKWLDGDYSPHALPSPPEVLEGIKEDREKVMEMLGKLKEGKTESAQSTATKLADQVKGIDGMCEFIKNNKKDVLDKCLAAPEHNNVEQSPRRRM